MNYPYNISLKKVENEAKKLFKLQMSFKDFQKLTKKQHDRIPKKTRYKLYEKYVVQHRRRYEEALLRAYRKC